MLGQLPCGICPSCSSMATACFWGVEGLGRCSQRRAGSLDWSTKLLAGVLGSPGGARAGRVEHSRCPCAWYPAGVISVWSNPSCGIPCQLTCTPFCLVLAVVVSHQAWNWAGEGESPSLSLQFCSGGSCENWRDLVCQLCSHYRGPGCACCFLCHPILYPLGLPSSKARVSPCPRDWTPIVVSLCLSAPLLSRGAQALLGSWPGPVPGGVGPIPSSPAACLSPIYC